MAKKLRTYIKIGRIGKGLKKPIAGFLINTTQKLAKKLGFVEIETDCCGKPECTTTTTTTTTTSTTTTTTTHATTTSTSTTTTTL